METATAIIETRGLVKRFAEANAVAGIDLAVPPGGVYGFLGPNGAGKTTTIRILVGLLWPTRGTSRIFGEAVEPGAPVLRRVGSLIERPAFYPYLSAFENLAVFGTAHGLERDLLVQRAAYRSDVADPDFPNAFQIRQEILSFSEFGGMTQAEIDAQIDEMVAQQVASYDQERVSWDARQQVALQKYDGLQSVFTIIGGGLMPILALVLGASLALGDEFRFGTIRTSLLAASNRRRFLAARLISYVTMTLGLFGLLALLGLGLGVGLRIVGAEVAATVTPLDPVSSLAWLVAQVLIATTMLVLAVALTVLLRSGALPLLLILIAALMELFIANLPIFFRGEALAAVPQAFPTTSMRTLTTILGYQTHAVVLADAQAPPMAIDLPMIVVAGIVAAWGLLFLVIADRRIRTMDVTE